MDVIYSLTGPLGRRLTWTLLHFLWQGTLLAIVLGSVTQLLRVRSAAARCRLTLATLMLMAACPPVTFWLVRPEQFPEPTNLLRWLTVDAPLAWSETPGAGQPALSPQRQVSMLARWQPYLLAGWAFGAGLLGLRLIIGGTMAWRLRYGQRPLDQTWADRAGRLALRLGLRRARVFVSEHVRQSLVTGLWRPIVLVPAAWLAEMTPEMLEGVLAHELAHLRRGDLWAILLQRLVETFLFYHPAVWWLSRRLNREREMCCDEMAVAATGDRLALTKALQWVVQGRAAGTGLVLAAGWKGRENMILERIRRVLGVASPRERFSWLPLGSAVLVVAATLVLSAIDRSPPLTAAGAEPHRTAGLYVGLDGYRIEPPDVLELEVRRLAPLPAHHNETSDTAKLNGLYLVRNKPTASGRATLGAKPFRRAPK